MNTEEVLLAAGRRLVASLDLESVLKEFLSLARDMTGARYAALGVLSQDGSRLENFFVSGFDDATVQAIGDLPRGEGLLGLLMYKQEVVRISDIANHSASVGFPEHHPPMKTFLGVPVVIQGRVYGNLYLTEKEHGLFTEEDEETVLTLASWAAIAINNARSVAHERLAQSVSSAEQERIRWARELHDGILQSLAAVRVTLTAALASKQPQNVVQTAEHVVEQLEHDIRDLRGLITDLRPAVLDTFGLIPALEDLVERFSVRAGFDIGFSADTRARQQLLQITNPDLETTIYRIVQEALTNTLKHAHAQSADVTLAVLEGRRLQVCIRDNGQGFQIEEQSQGVGIIGMRERAQLVGGTLCITAEPKSGTIITFAISTESKPQAQTIAVQE